MLIAARITLADKVHGEQVVKGVFRAFDSFVDECRNAFGYSFKNKCLGWVSTIEQEVNDRLDVDDEYEYIVYAKTSQWFGVTVDIQLNIFGNEYIDTLNFSLPPKQMELYT